MRYGVHAVMNRRKTMEDRIYIGQLNGRLFAAVYDGHGGDEVARYLQEHFHHVYEEIKRLGVADDEALRQAYRQVDSMVQQQRFDFCGSCATTTLINGDDVVVANVGDSHAVVVSTRDVVTLTTDHRVVAADQQELERIRDKGAHILVRGDYQHLTDGNGTLMVTRAFGDLPLRRVGVIAEPAVKCYAWRPGDRYLIVASDGLYDAVGADHNQLIDWLLPIYGQDPSLIAESLVEHAQPETRDNISVIVIER